MRRFVVQILASAQNLKIGKEMKSKNELLKEINELLDEVERILHLWFEK